MAWLMAPLVAFLVTAPLKHVDSAGQQKVREAGSGSDLNNDYSAEYLWGIPKKDQPLKEVEDLLLQQVEHLRKGEFDDWIIPAIINDFKKNRKAQLESDGGRIGLMREAFLSYEDWDFAVGEIARME